MMTFSRRARTKQLHRSRRLVGFEQSNPKVKTGCALLSSWKGETRGAHDFCNTNRRRSRDADPTVHQRSRTITFPLFCHQVSLPHSSRRELEWEDKFTYQ